MNKIKIKIKGYDSKVIETALTQILSDVEKTGAAAVSVILPNRRSLFCVHRGPHIDAKSKEHFEMRKHSRLIIISDFNSKTIESLTHLQVPSGVSIEIK